MRVTQLPRVMWFVWLSSGWLYGPYILHSAAERAQKQLGGKIRKYIHDA